MLVHGANAVCGVPSRQAAKDHRSELALGLSFFLALGFAWTLVSRRGLSPARVVALLAAAAAIAAPGLRAVWMDRADAPLNAEASARQVATLVDELDAFATARSDCLEAVHNDCEECQPIVRFVLPVHTTCAHPRGRIDLRRDALATGCTVRGDTLECGTGDAEGSPAIASRAGTPLHDGAVSHVSANVGSRAAPGASPAVVSHVTTGVGSHGSSGVSSLGSNATM